MSESVGAASLVDQANLLLQAGNPRQAVQMLSKLLEQNTGDATVFHTMAIAALTLGEVGSAVLAAGEAVQISPRSASFQYTFGRTLKAADRIREAIDAYRTAIRLNPDVAEYHVSLAVALRKEGKKDKAASAYRSALKLRPDMVQAIHNLANLHAETGDIEAAEAGYRRALERQPDYAPALYELGNLAHKRGDKGEAKRWYQGAVAARPDYGKAWHALGAMQYHAGDFEAAEVDLERAVSADPRNAKSWQLLGLTLNNRRKRHEAIESLRNCLALDADNLDALIPLGALLRGTGQHLESAQVLQRAIAVNPKAPPAEAHFCLAETLMALNAYAAAAQHLEQGIALNTGEMDVDAHFSLGMTYRMLWRLRDAWDQAEKIHARLPDSSVALSLLAAIQSDLGEAEAAADGFANASRVDPHNHQEKSKHCMSLSYIAQPSLEDILHEHAEYGARFAFDLRDTAPFNNTAEPDRRLRVGYVSADFRNHSVAWFIEPILRAHDRAGFEVFAYFTHARADAVTERLRGYCDGWVAATGLDDAELAERIRADGIDILIDLAGHTAGNRLGVFARKPAPVQMTWLGYLTTTGVDAIDYRLTDARVDPDGAEAWQAETPLRLPGCYVCYGPPKNAPEAGTLPAHTRGAITFGSFNNLAKLSSDCLLLWSRVLQAVPDSRLLLKSRAMADAWARDRLLRRFGEEGIGQERLILTGWTDATDAHLATYQQVDIALDSYPYNGVTTTCEALWMGVPVLSLTGLTPASRQGLTLLNAVGLGELACADPAGLIARAQQLASNLDGLEQLRRDLRARVANSSLTDAACFTAHLERAFRIAWRHWCAGAETA
ncbi:MAG: tetratricopeptide repeat protein [Thiobacillaceae bacterium]